VSEVRVEAVVDEAAARWPERVAVHDEHGALTFAALAAAVHDLRDRLVAAGIGPGQGLGVMARNGRGFVVGVFAGLAVGAVVMPLAPTLKRAEVDGLLREAPLHAVLDDLSGPVPVDEGRPIDGVGGPWRLASTGRDRGEPFVPHVPDAAFVRFTSGTTGASKGVVVGHRSVLARTAAAAVALGLGPDTVVVWVLPMAYHFIVSVVAYVRSGATMVVCRDLLAASIVQATNAHGGTLLYAAPTHVRLLAADTSGARMPTLRRAISTSAGIPRDVALAFRDRHGLPVTQVYGIIELGLPAGNLDEADAHPDAIGRALPGYEVAVLDDDLRPVGDGVVGQLALRGPGMFDAYLSPPRLREDVLREGWFLTGDLAVRDATGLVTVAGRRKSLVNAAGLKVFPEEVEAVIDAFPGVARSRVTGEPHPILGEAVVADVEVEPGETVDLEALRRFCRERLSMHKVPQRLRLVDAVPLTPTGKVARA
jgi:acyl-CoA synthetase (AMP-forming)/AMP-acid ligase II